MAYRNTTRGGPPTTSGECASPVPASIHHPAGRWLYESDFDLDQESGRDLRRSAVALLAEGCAARDDLGLVLSELLGNIVIHGGGGRVSLSLFHGEGELLCRLVHHKIPATRGPAIPVAVAVEIAELLDVEAADDELISALSDGGRGLFCASVVTNGSLRTQPFEHRTVQSWRHEECGCAER
ncbi:hypothetical protein GCM10027589_08930 [Actinocorallia lasiicapitis]